MSYRVIAALTFSSMDAVKHRLQRRCPEYGLKKNASPRPQAKHDVSAEFITLCDED
jgi:hypothetical protein